VRGLRHVAPVRVGIVAVLLIALGTYFAFAKDIPFTRSYEVKAVFQDTAKMSPGSPVRIAGVGVGKVTKVEPAGEGSTASELTMQISDEGLPIHRDARLRIRPRIFLEGNFFVDLHPGTGGAPVLEDGATVPATQTSASVTIDQVLSTLKSDTRADLRKLLRGYGDAVGGRPTAAQDADADPRVAGQTAGQSLNDSLAYGGDALRDTAVVNDALQGTELRDLSRLIEGTGKVTRALDSRERQLAALIGNFSTTVGALAAEQDGLRRTVRALPRLLEAANPALDSLNSALPSTRAFAREILPGIRETPATIDAALPWIAQTRALVSPAELQGAVRDLRPATADLASFIDGSVRLLPRLDLFNRCLTENLLPTGDVVIRDDERTTGLENYREFFQSLVGLSGESQNFDGNGQYTRFQTGSGANIVSTGALPETGKLFANAPKQPIGSRPARPAKRPPYVRDQACHRQRRPNLNAAKTGGGP